MTYKQCNYKKTNSAGIHDMNCFVHCHTWTLYSHVRHIEEIVNLAWTNVRRGLSGAPLNDAYLPWDARGVETIKADEEEKLERIKEVMERMQKHNFDLHRHAFRATHVKTQGVVKGKLQVRSDLPEHLCQGIFTEPGKVYDVAARYANEPYFLHKDQESGPRGL
jgi:hypothetical protein